MIEIVTFTGVDAETDLDRLVRIGQQYPKAEFGVLVGSTTHQTQDHGIFPSVETIDKLRSSGVCSAIHLCGAFSRSVTRGPTSDELYSLSKLCEGFARVQVNLPSDALAVALVDMEPSIALLHLERFASAVEAEHVILQHRSPWNNVPVANNPKIEYLWDASGGAGMESFDLWPEPVPVLGRVGYAGGLGPHNVDRAVAFANRFPDIRLWFDMEGRIRTDDDRFDLDAVEAVCQQVWGGPILLGTLNPNG